MSNLKMYKYDYVWIKTKSGNFALARKNPMKLKDVWFESNVVRNQKNVLKIQNAIHEVTGIHFNEYTTKSRKRDGFFARMLFAKHCSQRMKPMEIATMINRDRTTVLSLLKKYDDEVKYNPYFRVLAQRVENIINKTSNEATTKA